MKSGRGKKTNVVTETCKKGLKMKARLRLKHCQSEYRVNYSSVSLFLLLRKCGCSND